MARLSDANTSSVICPAATFGRGPVLEAATLGAAAVGGGVTTLIALLLRRIEPDTAARVGPPAGVGMIVAGAVVGVTCAARLAPAPAVIATVTLSLLLAAAVVDLVERRLPDRLTLPAAAVAAAGFTTVGLLQDGPWLRSLTGGALLGGALLVLGLIDPAAVGLGDAKAGISIGVVLGWAGWPTWFAGVLAGLLLLLAAAAVLRLSRRGRARPLAGAPATLPYGPWLLTGAVLGLLLPATT